MEQTIPEVLKTANEAVAEVKRANDALPVVVGKSAPREPKRSSWSTMRRKLFVIVGRQAKRRVKAPWPGFLPAYSSFRSRRSSEMRRSRQEHLHFETELTEQDREILRERTGVALEDPKLGTVYPWSNRMSGNSGTIPCSTPTAARAVPAAKLRMLCKRSGASTRRTWSSARRSRVPKRANGR